MTAFACVVAEKPVACSHAMHVLVVSPDHQSFPFSINILRYIYVITKFLFSISLLAYLCLSLPLFVGPPRSLSLSLSSGFFFLSCPVVSPLGTPLHFMSHPVLDGRYVFSLFRFSSTLGLSYCM